jgi:hypothetical protein
MVSRGLSHETIYSNYSNPIPRNRWNCRFVQLEGSIG